MKKLFYLLMFAAATFCITSCGSDGDDNNPENGGSSGGSSGGGSSVSSTFKGPQAVLGNNRIKKLAVYYSDSEEIDHSHGFSYDNNGYVSDITNYDENGNIYTRIVFSYENGVNGILYDKNGNPKQHLNPQIGGNGFVVYGEQVDEKGNNEYSRYTYNTSDQIQSVTHGDVGESTPSDDVQTVTYSDGNLIKVTEGSTIIEAFYSTESLTAITNTTGMMLYDICYHMDGVDEVGAWFFCGLIGKGGKNLPLVVKETNGNETITYNYTWTLDNQNRPTQLIRHKSSNKSDNTSTKKYTLEWY